MQINDWHGPDATKIKTPYVKEIGVKPTRMGVVRGLGTVPAVQLELTQRTTDGPRRLSITLDHTEAYKLMDKIKAACVQGAGG